MQRVMGPAIGAEPYPFQGRYFPLGDLRYHYLDEGAGDTVVMIHGNPTWSIYYRQLVQALRGRHRCIVPDHIGCGFSDKPDDSRYDYTLSRRVDDLERLLEGLGLTRDLTLVLHDWGGMIGMAYAARHPEAIRRLVLLNTAAFLLPEAKSFPWPLRLARDTRLGGYLVRRFNAFSRAAARVGCTRRPMPAALRAAYEAPYDSWQNRIATLRFVQDIPLGPDDAAYAEVVRTQAQLAQFNDLPVMICWGDRDFVFDHHFLDAWRHYLPAARVHRFPDCGHYILEDAAEEVTFLIRSFLQEHPIRP